MATLHAESLPHQGDVRAEQFKLAAAWATSERGPAAVVGDLNVVSLDELRPCEDADLVDAYIAATGRADDTFNLTYSKAAHGSSEPKRLDYVFAHDARPVSARLLGNEPLVNEQGELLECLEGRDGHVFPSDHLGVEVELELPRADRRSQL